MESLNPLVKIETVSHYNGLDDDALNKLVAKVDLVCVTDWSRERLVSNFLPLFLLARS